MSPGRARFVSLAVGVAAAGAVLMVGRAVVADAGSTGSVDRQVAQRSAQLDRYEASLRRALAQRPPQLPPLVSSGAAATAQAAGAAPRVVYRRPAPRVVVVARRGGEQEYEGGADD